MRLLTILLILLPGIAFSQVEKTESKHEPVVVICFDRCQDVKAELEKLTRIYFDEAWQNQIREMYAPYTSILMDQERVFAAGYSNETTGGIDFVVGFPIEASTEKFIQTFATFGDWAGDGVTTTLQVNGVKWYLNGRGNHVLFATDPAVYEKFPQNPEKVTRSLRHNSSLVQAAVYPQRFPTAIRNQVGFMFQIPDAAIWDEFQQLLVKVDFQSGGVFSEILIEGRAGSQLQKFVQAESRNTTSTALRYYEPRSAMHGYLHSRSAMPLLNLVEAMLVMVDAMAYQDPSPLQHQFFEAVRRNKLVDLAFSFGILNDKPAGILGIGIQDPRALTELLPKTHQVPSKDWGFETLKTDDTGYDRRSFLNDSQFVIGVNAGPDDFENSFQRPSNRIMNVVLKVEELFEVGNVTGFLDDLPGSYEFAKTMFERYRGQDDIRLTVDTTEAGFKMQLQIETAVVAGAFYLPYQLGANMEVARSETKPSESTTSEAIVEPNE